MRRISPTGLVALVLVAAACGPGLEEPYCEGYDCACPPALNCALIGTGLRFEVRDRQPDFFGVPWPSDQRLNGAGGPNLAGFPNPADSSMLADYLETVEAETRDWGTNQAIYFTFDGPLDAASLPADPAASRAEDAAVFLVDLSDGPDRGQRMPVAVRLLAEQRQFTPAHTLVLRPELGFPLRPRTRYAAVVTRAVRDAAGQPLGAPDTFERTKYTEPPLGASLLPWWEAYQPIWDELEAVCGLGRERVAGLAVFTTQDIHGEMDALAGWVRAEPPPAVYDWAQRMEKADLVVLEGWFDMPEFQAGEPPDFAGGGGFVFDADGTPVVQRRSPVAFDLALPAGPPPAAGWPLVIYAHGTGGSRHSFVNAADDVADALARRGIASISIDQPLHGERNPWGRDENIITFNPYNILAMRDNFRQGAVDLLVLRHLLHTLQVPAAVAPDGTAVAFDAERVGYMGHSQGCLNGAIYLALAEGVAGAVLSGSGGGLGPAILGKTEPIDIPALIILGMGLEADEFDLDHPVVAVFQLFAERADPLNYARRLIAAPPAGTAPKHLFFSQGLLDRYALPEQAAAMAAAAGCAPMEPLVEPIAAFALRGHEPLPPPVTANAAGPDGAPITAVMVQYPDDGHFAVFDNPDAQRHYQGFLAGLFDAEPPVVGP